MRSLIIPGLILNINENAILYKVPKSAIENEEELQKYGIIRGDYIFSLEKTGKELSEEKLKDLPPEEKHKLLIGFVKKFSTEQSNNLKEKYHIDDSAIYFLEGRRWPIFPNDKVYLQEIKGFEIRAHLINEKTLVILIYARRAYCFVTENGKLASVADMKNLFSDLKDKLKGIKVLYLGQDEKYKDSLEAIYFEPSEKIKNRADYDGPIAKLKKRGYKPLDRIYPIFDDTFRNAIQKTFVDLINKKPENSKLEKILSELTMRAPSDYIEATEKLRSLLQKNELYKKIFVGEPKIITRDIIEHTEGIRYGLVKDYELVFGEKNYKRITVEAKSVRDIIKTIRDIGPFDDIHKKTNKERVNIGIIYEEGIWKSTLEKIKKYLEKSLEQLKVKAHFLQPKKLSFMETIDCDVLIHIHRYETKDYWMIKELYLREGIPPQAILLETYLGIDNKNPYFNNIAIGIFAKLGGRPWVIGKAISDLLGKSAYYVGFDVSRMAYEGQHASAACIVAYDGEGTYVKHKPIDITVSKEHLDEENAERLMTMIIKDYIDTIKKRRLMDKKEEFFIVFMRDGTFSNSEVTGFKEALKIMNSELKDKGYSFKIGLLLLEFRKEGGIPLCEKSSDKENQYDLAQEGTYILFKTLESPKNKYALYIQTLGKDSGFKLVRSVKVTPHYYSFGDNDYYGWPEDQVDDLALAIYRLSRLNWSSFRGRSKLPVTIHYAHKMAYFMEKGVSSKTIEEAKLYFL